MRGPSGRKEVRHVNNSADRVTSISGIRVAALEFAVTASDLVGMWTWPTGKRERFRVGSTLDLVPGIDALRSELRDPMAISAGETPRLREFMTTWGLGFLPAALTSTSARGAGRAEGLPHVVVIIPHGPTHDLPMHLIQVPASDGSSVHPLGVSYGITYASSRSLFIRNVARNPARQRNLAQWRAGFETAPHTPVRSVMSGGVDVLGDLNQEFEDLCRLVAERFTGKRTTFLHPGIPYSRTALKAATRKASPSVLCVMAHGFVDDDNHRMSGLLVARDTMGIAVRPIPLHDGRYFDFRDLPLRRAPRNIRSVQEVEVFTAAELEVDARIDSELVLLLGCSAGWGRVLQGDEPASLAETWLKIGAASVAAPLWDAPIGAVRDWTSAFLDGWTRLDLPKALAMRQAMQQMFEGPFRDSPERLGVMTLRGDWL